MIEKNLSAVQGQLAVQLQKRPSRNPPSRRLRHCLHEFQKVRILRLTSISPSLPSRLPYKLSNLMCGTQKSMRTRSVDVHGLSKSERSHPEFFILTKHSFLGSARPVKFVKLGPSQPSNVIDKGGQENEFNANSNLVLRGSAVDPLSEHWDEIF
jgi:hypothetical protein